MITINKSISLSARAEVSPAAAPAKTERRARGRNFWLSFPPLAATAGEFTLVAARRCCARFWKLNVFAGVARFRRDSSDFN